MAFVTLLSRHQLVILMKSFRFSLRIIFGQVFLLVDHADVVRALLKQPFFMFDRCETLLQNLQLAWVELVDVSVDD